MLKFLVCAVTLALPNCQKICSLFMPGWGTCHSCATLTFQSGLLSGLTAAVMFLSRHRVALGVWPWQWVLKPGVFSDRAPVMLKAYMQPPGEQLRVKLDACQVGGAAWGRALVRDRPETRTERIVESCMVDLRTCNMEREMDEMMMVM